MTAARIATLADVEALQDVLAELQANGVEIERLALGGRAVINHNLEAGGVDTAEAAATGALAAIEGPMRERAGLLERFEGAVEKLIGERRRPGEPPEDFLGRIQRLGHGQLLATMRRHGIGFQP